MAPLVRRTWSMRGQTPFLYQRTRSHKKISVIGALRVAPYRRRLHLFFRLHADTNINGELVKGFLKNLLKQLKGPIVLIWDRWRPHSAKKVQTLVYKSKRLHIFFLPPYAPELNPMEYVWGHMKMNPMANLVITDIDSLADITRHHGRSLQRKQSLLRSFLKHTPLLLRLK